MYCVRIKRGALRLLCVICLAATGAVQAQLEALTSDGRRVLLKDDQTWEFMDDAEQASGEANLVLSVTSKESKPNACLLWVKLDNNADYMVKSIVPQFGAYVSNDVLYEKVFTGFSGLKPTKDQTKAVQFRGISCDEIEYVKVTGADRCVMGDLGKYASEKGECLRRVRLVESQLVKFVK